MSTPPQGAQPCEAPRAQSPPHPRSKPLSCGVFVCFNVVLLMRTAAFRTCVGTDSRCRRARRRWPVAQPVQAAAAKAGACPYLTTVVTDRYVSSELTASPIQCTALPSFDGLPFTFDSVQKKPLRRYFIVHRSHLCDSQLTSSFSRSGCYAFRLSRRSRRHRRRRCVGLWPSVSSYD